MDIAAWLTDLGLERYAEQFGANEIDKKTLRDLKRVGCFARQLLAIPAPSQPACQS